MTTCDGLAAQRHQGVRLRQLVRIDEFADDGPVRGAVRVHTRNGRHPLDDDESLVGAVGFTKGPGVGAVVPPLTGFCVVVSEVLVHAPNVSARVGQSVRAGLHPHQLRVLPSFELA